MRNTYMMLVMVFLLLFSVNSFADLDKHYTIKDKITLKGVLKSKQFTDANDQPEGAYILELQKPISVSKDETGGPESNVMQIQLAILYKKYKKADLCLNKKITVTGYLYYPFDAHHHTQVLLRVLDFNCSKN